MTGLLDGDEIHRQTRVIDGDDRFSTGRKGLACYVLRKYVGKLLPNKPAANSGRGPARTTPVICVLEVVNFDALHALQQLVLLLGGRRCGALHRVPVRRYPDCRGNHRRARRDALAGDAEHRRFCCTAIVKPDAHLCIVARSPQLDVGARHQAHGLLGRR